MGGVLARWARAGHIFLTIPHPCLCLPPPHQTIWSAFSPCLRIWRIFGTQFMMMARVGVGSGRGNILCCGILIFWLMQGALQGRFAV